MSYLLIIIYLLFTKVPYLFTYQPIFYFFIYLPTISLHTNL